VHWSENPKELKKRRKENGLSQADLANLIGVTRQVIADIESGRRKDWNDVRSQLWEAIANRAYQLSQKPKQHFSLAALNDPDKRDELFRLHQAEQRNNAIPEAKVERLEALVRILQRLDQSNKELISIYQNEVVPELRKKDARITELQKQVSELRSLYELGTQAALANEKFEQLREKLTLTPER
jgi:transcriptional regulator with XRE-family HTH domain